MPCCIKENLTTFLLNSRNLADEVFGWYFSRRRAGITPVAKDKLLVRRALTYDTVHHHTLTLLEGHNIANMYT